MKMFRTKKTVKTNRRVKQEDSPPLSRKQSEEDLLSRFIPDKDVSSEEKGRTLDFLKTLSSPQVERDEKTESHCFLKDQELRDTLHKLGNSLYYLASIIPDEDTWTCHFVDTPPHKDNITKAKDKRITISATLNSMTEQFILLPFGDKPMECAFSRQVEFTLTCSLGKTTIEAYHICERGVHKLLFPEEVTLDGREYNLRNVLPVRLEH